MELDDSCGDVVDDNNRAFSSTLESPENSLHWESLIHQDGDCLLRSPKEILEYFRSDLHKLPSDRMPETSEDIQILAFWSCCLGYIEALATHKQRRYHVYPVPLDALKRLVRTEFLPFLESIGTVNNSNNNKPLPKIDKTNKQKSSGNINNKTKNDSMHRQMVRNVSNGVWGKVVPKKHIKDEQHANSLYICLRGHIDKKSLDCFGAAVVTITGCLLKGLKSRLTLSEDHAYEQHTNEKEIAGTCEVAVPGSTKLAQSRRGIEIAETFDRKDSKCTLTPERSWLYMASNSVVCDSIPMTLVAVVGNMNCTIEKTTKGFFASRQLYTIKRDLLWTLRDLGHMSRFPFGLIELGDCEEHCGSNRGLEWVTTREIEEQVLMNEKLFLDAIQINKEIYDDSQTYPYFYAGHYHKDAGNEGSDNEYRLVHAMMYYAHAARVASKYRYEGVDSMQLNKHISSVAMLIAEDILTLKQDTKEPRKWHQQVNAISVCAWLIGFFDSLLFWEEQSGSKQFCEILSPSHKFSIGKLFQKFSEEIRRDAIAAVVLPSQPGNESRVGLPSFQHPRSNRLCSDSLLLKALKKPKVSIREMELTIPSTTDQAEAGTGRRSKRARRS